MRGLTPAEYAALKPLGTRREEFLQEGEDFTEAEYALIEQGRAELRLTYEPNPVEGIYITQAGREARRIHELILKRRR